MFIRIICSKLRLYVLIHKDNFQDTNFNLKSCILSQIFDNSFVPPMVGGKLALLPLGVYNKKAFFKPKHSSFFPCSEDKAS